MNQAGTEEGYSPANLMLHCNKDLPLRGNAFINSSLFAVARPPLSRSGLPVSAASTCRGDHGDKVGGHVALVA
jgi:hypothetical protein